MAKAIRQAPLPVQPIIIAVTGYGEDGAKERSREAGMDHHLIKPVEIAALSSLLAEIQAKAAN